MIEQNETPESDVDMDCMMIVREDTVSYSIWFLH